MLVRAISAIIGLSLIAFSWFFYKENGLIWVCNIVTLFIIKEYTSLFLKNERSSLILLLFAATLSFLIPMPADLIFIYFSSYLIISISYFCIFSKNEIPQLVHKILFFSLGLVYCVGLSLTVSLGILKFKLSFFIPLLIFSFLNDTFSYLGGRYFGKRPLAPKISPKKTWEGSISGLVGGGLTGFFYYNSIGLNDSAIIILSVCFLLPAFSQVGDLFESLLKRSAKVKDSGSILPGHGGALDRIDGLLFVAPLLYLWMTFYFPI